MSTIKEVAKQLTEIEKHTLTGQYEPEEDSTVYNLLEEAGLMEANKQTTTLGQKVRSHLINERRKNLDAQEKGA